jgi:uncharacterized protein (DUF2141 family)
MRRRTVLLALLTTLALPGTALAGGGNYVFDGGTRAQQRQVRAALNATSFDWNVVPTQVTIHVRPRLATQAARGHIWLDADLLDAGRFAWAAIQDEYPTRSNSSASTRRPARA